MNRRLIRCNVLAVLVTWLFIAVVSALHADEAGVIDWHHKLIGTPLEGSTFLHKPVAVSGALAFALTDKNVLAALNPRDGGIGRACFESR
jgi:ER membrane protein complex subunit 1